MFGIRGKIILGIIFGGIKVSLGSLGDGKPLWDYYQYECQKHVNMKLITRFDIFGVRILKMP